MSVFRNNRDYMFFKILLWFLCKMQEKKPYENRSEQSRNSQVYKDNGAKSNGKRVRFLLFHSGTES